MRVFVGCYTKKISEELVGRGEGIYSFNFDKDSGDLTPIDVEPALNPSYLSISHDKKYLYAVEEIPIEEYPKIKAYKINKSESQKSLSLINTQELPGSFACHLSLLNSQSHLVVAAYMSGNILVYPIGENGILLPMVQNIVHKGSGPNKTRQESAHVHMIQPTKGNGFYAVDLGLDLAKHYDLDKSEYNIVSQSSLDLHIEDGAGARHMVIHPHGNYYFIFGELTAEVFSFKRSDNGIEFLENVNSLPDDVEAIPSGAAIRMHPNGKYLYVSNRGHNSIAIFNFDITTEKMIFIDRVYSGGETPRDFNIDPTGNWLLVANQDSDNIVVFKISQENGLLQRHSVNRHIKTGCCIQFIC